MSHLEDKLLNISDSLPEVPQPKDTNRIVIRKLMCVFMLSCTFMLIEIAGGIISNSLAILADAGHLFSDLLGFAISIISVWISGFSANRRHTYGYHRAGVIGALASVMIIWGLLGFLIYYAVQRVVNLETLHVDGKVMFFTACFGLLTNILMIKVLNWESSLKEEDEKIMEKEKLEAASMRSISKIKKVDDVTAHATMIEATGKPQNDDARSPDREARHHHHHHHHNVSIEDMGCKNETYSPPSADEYSDKDISLRIKEKKNSSILIVDRKESDRNEAVDKEKNVKENFNIRATIIHIIGDMIQSIGVVFAAGLIWYDPVNLKIADPIITFVFSVIVMFTTIRIVRDCIVVLMEAAPLSLNVKEFESKLKNVEGIIGVHDLHIWSLNEEKPAMSCHVYTLGDSETILKKVTKICRIYGIYHSTIQVEIVHNKDEELISSCHGFH